MTNLLDGLASGELRTVDLTATGSVQAALISGATTQVGATEIGTDEIADDAITAAKQVHTDAGTNVLSSGSRWVSFAETYTSSPSVVACPTNEPIDSDFLYMGTGSVTAGSFIAVGSGTSTGSFIWIAFG